MATTHKQSPQQIAQQVIDSSVSGDLDQDSWALSVREVRDLIMLGIAAYNDASNQRPENLSEACARLGINLHWKFSHELPPGPDSYFVFYGLATPLAGYPTEEQAILELERIMPDAEKFGVQVWVEAVL